MLLIVIGADSKGFVCQCMRALVCVYMCACGEMAHLVFREPHSSHLIELGEAVGEILQPGMSKVDKSRLVHRNNIKNRSNAFRLQNRNKHPS